MRFPALPFLKFRYVVVLWAGIVSFAVAQGMQGQESSRGIQRADSAITTAAPEGMAKSSSAGLFIGVHEFQDPEILPVPFAVDDAVDLAYLFVKTLELIPAANVVLALAGEPYKDSSKDKLQELHRLGAKEEQLQVQGLFDAVKRLGKRVGSNGVFVVSVATHGILDENAHHFLMAQGSVLQQIKDSGMTYEKKAARSIDRDQLIDAVDRTSAARKLVLIDACQERLDVASARGAKGAIRAVPPSAQLPYRGRVALFAAQAGDLAFDDHQRGNGVFSAAIVDGLEGAAHRPGSSVITVADLLAYVNDEVIKWRRRFRHRISGNNGIDESLPESLKSMPLVQVLWDEVRWTDVATPSELECPRKPGQTAKPAFLGQRASSMIFLSRSSPDDAFRYLVLGREARQVSFGRTVYEYELAVICKSSKLGAAWPLGEIARPGQSALSYREQPKLGGKSVTDMVLPLTDPQGRRGSLFWNGERLGWSGSVIRAATIVPPRFGPDKHRQLLLVTDSDVVSVTVTRSPPAIVSQQRILLHGGGEAVAATWQHKTAIVMLDSEIVMLKELADGSFQEFSSTSLPATHFTSPVRSLIDFPSLLDSTGIFLVHPQACDPSGEIPFIAFRLDLEGDWAAGRNSPLSKIGQFEVKPAALRSQSCAVHLVPRVIGKGGRTFKVHALYNCLGSSDSPEDDESWCHQAFLRQGSEPPGRKLDAIGSERRRDGRLNNGAVSHSGGTLNITHVLNGEPHEAQLELE